ncbi:MAG: proline dehydrogenase family protein [Vulcanibacillus sp.]
MSFNNLGRKIILGVADNKTVTNFVTKYGMNLGAKRFIAGESLENSIDVIKNLNNEGLLVTIDHVGESTSSRDEAIEATEEAIRIFEIIDRFKLNANVSVKLTQLGLLINKDLCKDNISRIVATAKNYNNFVRIDIEDSPVIQITIDIFREVLVAYGKEYVGLALQSYLYRTEEDTIALGDLDVNLRIVKGAYKEPKEVAFPIKNDVDVNFKKIVRTHLGNGHYTAIATHDEKIIEDIKRFASENNIANDSFEFQMLYGVSNVLQRSLVKEGYRVRVYTPYGLHWYPYFSRRIAERPANGLFVLKGLFN